MLVELVRLTPLLLRMLKPDLKKRHKALDMAKQITCF